MNLNVFLMMMAEICIQAIMIDVKLHVPRFLFDGHLQPSDRDQN